MPALIGIGVDPAFLGHVRSQMILDILTVLLVACLVAVEILLVVTGATSLQIGRWKGLAEAAAAGRFGDLPSARAHGGMGALFDWYEQARQAVRAGRGRAEETAVAAAPAMVGTSDRSAFNIAGMRLSIFLFVLGEEMIRPFIPLFARQLAAGGPVPPNWVAAAPIGVFMLIWALSQLFGPGVSSILGGRRSLALSAILSAFSMVMMGLADGFSGFMIWRCLEAVGFGMVLFTAQGIVLANTGLDNRGAGFAAYVGGILTAGVCGPALGGVAAEQLGLTADFVIGGSMFLVSLVAFLTLTGEESDSAAAGASVLSKNTLSLFSSRRLLSILGLSGLPNRLATTAILFYVFPLYLTAAGIGKAGVGRVLLLYYVGYILSTPMSVRLAERFSLREVFVVGGGLLSGAACLIFLLHPSPWLVSLSCFLLGLAQGPSTLQASLLTTSCKADRLAISESAALGVFRFSERIGSSMAPFLAAALTAPFGYGGAASGMGVVLSIASVLFLLLFRSPGRGGLDQEA